MTLHCLIEFTDVSDEHTTSVFRIEHDLLLHAEDGGLVKFFQRATHVLRKN